VLYSFLPSQFSDADFLISPVPPASLTSGAVGTMPATCLGSVPQQFGLENLADFIYMLYKWGFFDLSNSELRSWFWIAGIGELVLKPFLLYDATYSSSAPYLLPAGPFSTSPAYVNGSLVAQNPGLASASFYTLAPDRPTLIVNTNVLNGDYLADPPQMPVQATAISTGAPGCAPGGMLQGGGAVESFAFTANLSGSAGAGEASVNVNRWYSLCDMAGCSSAFFAEYLLQYINAEIDKLIAAIAAKYGLSKFEQLALKALLVVFSDVAAQEVLPAYNYWTLGEVTGTNPVNQTYGFSDGGDFDNTGILGALAQTNVNRIVAFVNSEIPISKSNSAYFLDGSLPLLFGSYYPVPSDPSNPQPYQSYGGMSSAEPMSYVQVFDNSAGQLDTLCEGLYNASCGGANQDSNLGSYSAVFAQSLCTVDNVVAGIAGGRQVTVVWVYNNRVNQWQTQITDQGLIADLNSGQAGSPSGPLANFPHYDTGLQIYLLPEAVNMLAQLSAWNVQQVQGDIAALFKD